MIILGKKYLFNEMELVFMQKKSGNLSWLSFSQSDFATLKKSIDEIIAKYGPQHIVLNSRQNPTNELLTYLTHLELEGNSFITTEHFMESELNKCYIPEDNSDLNYLQNISSYTPFQYFQKRIIDYIGSIGLLLVAWPVMLYTAYRIKKESPGPVFFRQSRIGIHGKPFQCIKFRSMHVNGHHDPYTRENDPRIFDYGAFIRRTRIDELPQIFNVLKGDMHFIGPRAEWDILVEEYEKEIPFYQKRHLVRPGITGNAQVNYPYGQNLDDTRQKLMYDFYYIKHWSFWSDIEIIYKTIHTVLEKKGL
ncbi:MAG: sugar transferase [Helicobacteraceae bacterium 4484_230]|nr:MAG: sugar transferase [Helicobacteraceae bacterium 4484_230]